MSLILVTGVTGQVGSELMKSLQGLGEVKGIGRNEVDLSDPEQIRKVIEQLRPDVIINPAAYTAVDKAESEAELADSINAQAPRIFAEEAKKNDILLVHFSTDYVFDGQKNQPYNESDATHPINTYGRSKLAGEQAVQQQNGDYLILRTSWVYSRHGQNFFNSMKRLMQEREELGIVDDQIGSPTSAGFIASRTAAIVKKAIVEKKQNKFESGIYHLTAGGQTSWYQFALAIKNKLQAEGVENLAALKPIKTAEYPTPAKRAAYSVLDCNRIQQRYGVDIPDWQELLYAL